MKRSLAFATTLLALIGALPIGVAAANPPAYRLSHRAVTPELLDQAFASLKGFDVKPEADAPPTKEAEGQKKSPYAIYRLELEQQLSDWQGVIEMAVAQAQQDAARRSDLEQRFLALLQTGVSKAAQRYVCRQLALIASARAVPAMAPLLDDPDLAHMALFVLEQVPGPVAEQLLLEKLATTRPPEKIGIIGSLGKRRAVKATGPLAALLKDSDPEVAAAAVGALGNMGTPEAAQALMPFRPAGPPRLSMALEDALLRVADRLAVTSAKAQAQEIYQRLCNPASRRLIRLAGLRGLLAVEPEKALVRLLAAVQAAEPAEQSLIIRMVADLPARQDCAAVVKLLPELPVAAQSILLGALAERKELSAKAAILQLAQQAQDLKVRRDAWEALSVLCDATDVRILAQTAATGEEQVRPMARACLANISGKEVDAVIAGNLAEAGSELRAELLKALFARCAPQARAKFRESLRDDAPAVRLVAARGLVAWGDETDVPLLLGCFQAAKAAAEREAMEEALSKIGSRNPQATVPLVLTAMGNAQGDSRIALLRLLSLLGGTEALSAVRRELKSTDPQIKDAALRTLTAWPEAEALPDLLALVKSETPLAQRVPAFQAYVRLLRDTPQLKDRAQLLAATMEIVPRPEDKKLVLAALGESPSLESLKLAEACLSDPNLVEEAAVAVVGIASAKGLKNTAYPAATAALAKVLQVAKIQSTRQQAQDILRKLEETSKGTKPPRP